MDELGLVAALVGGLVGGIASGVSFFAARRATQRAQRMGERWDSIKIRAPGGKTIVVKFDPDDPESVGRALDRVEDMSGESMSSRPSTVA